MTPMIIIALAFVSVTAIAGTLLFVFSGDGTVKTSNRLDTLTGKRKKEDEATNILRKSAFERDKKSLMEMITPRFPSLDKLFVQADCHIKPSTLSGVGMLLGVLGATASWVGGVKWYFAPIAGLIMFLVPWVWLLNKRRARLKAFSR